MNQRIWFGLCLLFVIYNLKLLLDDSNRVDYITVETTDDLYNNYTNFIICSPYSAIKLYDQLGRSDWPSNEAVSVQSFLNRSIRSIEIALNRTGLFPLNDSYVFNRHVCFKVNKTELENGERIGIYLQKYFVRLFAFSNFKMPFFYENINEKRNSDRYFLLEVHKQKVYDQRYLSNPNCFNHTNQYAMNRFLCLNFCFKKIEKFEQGFYSYFNPYVKKETVQLNLSYITHGMPELDRKFWEPKQFAEKRKKCLRKCPENDCFWVSANYENTDYQWLLIE